MRARSRLMAVRPRNSATFDPRVTVVIPCYNYARYLSDAVRSALDQMGVQVDVLVVDDASTDESLGVATGLAAHDSRVRVLANEVNSGAVATFNRGLAEATGEFIVRLDADDLLTPGSLERAVALLRNFPSVGLVYGRPIHFTDSHPLPVPRQRPRYWLLWAGTEWLRQRCLAGNNVITSPEVVMRKSVVDQVGGQQPLPHAHDMEMWLRMASVSDVGYIVGADQAWHREHSASLSLQNRDMIVERRERLSAFETLFSGIAGGLPQASGLHAAARHAIALEALDDACQQYDRGKPEAVMTGSLLAQFATECDPSITSHSSWGRWETRVRAGPDPHNPVRFAAAAQRGIARRLRTWRWGRTGVYERI